MEYFQASGSYHQLGFMHGQHYREQIQKAFYAHCDFNMTQPELEMICFDLDKKMKRFVPFAAEELRAIAEGSGLLYEQILQLNNWEDIVQLRGESKASCCTSIFFRNTPDGPILGKTTDIEPFQVADYFLFEIRPEEGFHSIILGKIGTLKCEAGMNEKGLCVGSNSSIEKNTSVGDVERMTLLRYTLQLCDSVDTAIAFLQKHRFYRLGLNITLMDLRGRAAVAECGNTAMSVREITQDVGFATNHYLTPEMEAKYDFDIWYYKNSIDRFGFLKEQLVDTSAKRTIEDMKRLIKAHPKSGGICNHTNCCETMYATIWLPKQKTVLVCDGRPCENDYSLYRLD